MISIIQIVIQIFRANKGGLGPGNQTGSLRAFYVEWHNASLWKYGPALSSADLSFGLACTSASQLATFCWVLVVLRALWWAAGKVEKMQGSLWARGQPSEPRGPELGTLTNRALGAPKVATKCLLYVQGQLQRGPASWQWRTGTA